MSHRYFLYLYIHTEQYFFFFFLYSCFVILLYSFHYNLSYFIYCFPSIYNAAICGGAFVQHRCKTLCFDCSVGFCVKSRVNVKMLVTWHWAVRAREWCEPAATLITSSPDKDLIHRGCSLQTHTCTQKFPVSVCLSHSYHNKTYYITQTGHSLYIYIYISVLRQLSVWLCWPDAHADKQYADSMKEWSLFLSRSLCGKVKTCFGSFMSVYSEKPGKGSAVTPFQHYYDIHCTQLR